MAGDKARIAAVGAGRMGRGIAHVFAFAGHEVALIDLKPRPAADAEALLAAARTELEADLSTVADLGLATPAQARAALARVGFAAEAEADAALRDADVVFEGVTETLDAKKTALARIEQAAPAAAILASTTSTISVEDLAANLARPERFLNAHWLNPAFLVPLVEVSPGAATAPAVTGRMTDLLRQAGKHPVVCAARPGFIVPRIQAVAMNEAARMAEEGVASPEEIDRAIRLGFGLRYAVMGLLEFVDVGGGDILYYASQYLQEALGSERYEAPEVVKRNMAEGRLGLRSGSGFYDFTGVDAAAYRREILGRYVTLLRHMDLLPKPGG